MTISIITLSIRKIDCYWQEFVLLYHLFLCQFPIKKPKKVVVKLVFGSTSHDISTDMYAFVHHYMYIVVVVVMFNQYTVMVGLVVFYSY